MIDRLQHFMPQRAQQPDRTREQSELFDLNIGPAVDRTFDRFVFAQEAKQAKPGKPSNKSLNVEMKNILNSIAKALEEGNLKTLRPVAVDLQRIYFGAKQDQKMENIFKTFLGELKETEKELLGYMSKMIREGRTEEIEQSPIEEILRVFSHIIDGLEPQFVELQNGDFNKNVFGRIKQLAEKYPYFRFIHDDLLQRRYKFVLVKTSDKEAMHNINPLLAESMETSEGGATDKQGKAIYLDPSVSRQYALYSDVTPDQKLDMCIAHEAVHAIVEAPFKCPTEQEAKTLLGNGQREELISKLENILQELIDEEIVAFLVTDTVRVQLKEGNANYACRSSSKRSIEMITYLFLNEISEASGIGDNEFGELEQRIHNYLLSDKFKQNVTAKLRRLELVEPQETLQEKDKTSGQGVNHLENQQIQELIKEDFNENIYDRIKSFGEQSQYFKKLYEELTKNRYTFVAFGDLQTIPSDVLQSMKELSQGGVTDKRDKTISLDLSLIKRNSIRHGVSPETFLYMVVAHEGYHAIKNKIYKSFLGMNTTAEIEKIKSSSELTDSEKEILEYLTEEIIAQDIGGIIKYLKQHNAISGRINVVPECEAESLVIGLDTMLRKFYSLERLTKQDQKIIRDRVLKVFNSESHQQLIAKELSDLSLYTPSIAPKPGTFHDEVVKKLEAESKESRLCQIAYDAVKGYKFIEYNKEDKYPQEVHDGFKDGSIVMCSLNPDTKDEQHLFLIDRSRVKDEDLINTIVYNAALSLPGQEEQKEKVYRALLFERIFRRIQNDFKAPSKLKFSKEVLKEGDYHDWLNKRIQGFFIPETYKDVYAVDLEQLKDKEETIGKTKQYLSSKEFIDNLIRRLESSGIKEELPPQTLDEEKIEKPNEENGSSELKKRLDLINQSLIEEDVETRERVAREILNTDLSDANLLVLDEECSKNKDLILAFIISIRNLLRDKNMKDTKALNRAVLNLKKMFDSKHENIREAFKEGKDQLKGLTGDLIIKLNIGYSDFDSSSVSKSYPDLDRCIKSVYLIIDEIEPSFAYLKEGDFNENVYNKIKELYERQENPIPLFERVYKTLKEKGYKFSIANMPFSQQCSGGETNKTEKVINLDLEKIAQHAFLNDVTPDDKLAEVLAHEFFHVERPAMLSGLLTGEESKSEFKVISELSDKEFAATEIALYSYAVDEYVAQIIGIVVRRLSADRKYTLKKDDYKFKTKDLNFAFDDIKDYFSRVYGVKWTDLTPEEQNLFERRVKEYFAQKDMDKITESYLVKYGLLQESEKTQVAPQEK